MSYISENVYQLNEDNLNKDIIHEIKRLTDSKLKNSLYASLSMYSFEQYLRNILKKKSIHIFIITKSNDFNGFFFCGIPKLQFDIDTRVKLIILIDLIFNFKLKFLSRFLFTKLNFIKSNNSKFSKQTIDNSLSILNIAMLKSNNLSNGNILIDKSIQSLRKIKNLPKFIFCTVYHNNFVAIDFYKKNNFEICGEIDNFFEKKILMIYKLNVSS